MQLEPRATQPDYVSLIHDDVWYHDVGGTERLEPGLGVAVCDESRAQLLERRSAGDVI
jgi:hypothetical protein